MRRDMSDLKLGAAPLDGGIAVVLEADRPYEGKLEFDIPRHRLYLGFKKDWPRMNTVPEWYTVEPDATPYEVLDVAARTNKICTGRELHEGLPVRVAAGQPRQLMVRRKVGESSG